VSPVLVKQCGGCGSAAPAGQCARGLGALGALPLFCDHLAGALAALRGGVQARFREQAQGMTNAEHRAGWRPQRRRFRCAALLQM
jgi:hypothetical protein